MTRSGIKQGLAVSAVSALTIVGLPAAAHAATAPVYTFTQSATSVSTGETATITITAPDDATAVALDASDVTATETFPASNGNTPSPVAITPTVSGDVDPTAGFAQTVSVAAPAAGTITVSFVDSNNANHVYTVAVGGDKVGAANVASLKTSSSSSVSVYSADLAATKVSVRPVDAAGFGVQSAQVRVQVDSATSTTLGAATAEGDYDRVATLGDAAFAALATPGTHTLKFWVDKANNGDVDGVADADEAPITVTVNVTAAPAFSALNTTLVAVGGTDTGAKDNDNLAGAAAVVGAKLTLKDSADKAVAGAKVRFDVYAGGPGPIGATPAVGKFQVSLSGTTDANGVVSVAAPLTAAQTKALAGGALYAETFLSASSTAGAGTLLSVDGGFQVAQFSNATYTTKLQGGATKLQATKGSAVNVNLVVTDQFGNPAVGHVLRVTGGAGANAAPAAPGDRLAATNAQGQTTFTYTDKVNTLGTDSFTFTDLGNGSTDPVAAPVSFDVQYVNSVTPGAIVDNGGFAATGATYTVNAKATNSYSVQITDGAVAPTNLANQKVTFTVDNGFLATTSGAKGTAKTVTVSTDANGIATVFAGSTKAGKQTVTATAGAAKALSSQADTFEADDFYHLDVTSSGDINTNSTGKVTISAVDQFGNAVQGEGFNVSQSGAGSLPNGTSSDYYYTGVNGTVTISIAGGATAGTGTLVVSNNNVGNNPVNKLDDASVSPYAGNQTVTYTVKAATIVIPPKPPVVTPAKPAIGKVVGKSQGKNDVLKVRVANANGKTVVVKVNGKKVGKAVVKNGVATVKVMDKNGKKATKYSAIVSGVKKTFKVK